VLAEQALQSMLKEMLEAILCFLPSHQMAAVEAEDLALVAMKMALTEVVAVALAQIHRHHSQQERQELETRLQHLHHKVITEVQILLAQLKEAAVVARLL
jgi:hypothetical protein